MQMIAVQALLFDLTDSGTWLGLSTVVTLVPALLLTPYAGVLADRISRVRILRVTQFVQMASAFALWAMYVTDVVTPWWIIAIGFVSGAASGFQTAAWQAFVPLLVPPEDILHAVRLNSVQNTLARAIGPAVGAIVLQLGGVGTAVFANGLTFLVVIAALFVVRPRSTGVVIRRQGVIEGFRDGAAYMLARRPLRLAVMLALATSTFGQSLQYVAAAVSERLFDHGGNGNAGLLAAMGVGSLLSSGSAVILGERVHRSTQVLLSLVLFSVAVGLMPLTSSYLVGQAAYFLAGVAHLQMTVAINTLIQATVPDEYRGRAISFYLIGILAGIPLGSQVLGTLGDVIGFRSTMFLDGAAFVALLVGLLATGWWRDLDVRPDEIHATVRVRTA